MILKYDSSRKTGGSEWRRGWLRITSGRLHGLRRPVERILQLKVTKNGPIALGPWSFNELVGLTTTKHLPLRARQTWGRSGPTHTRPETESSQVFPRLRAGVSERAEHLAGTEAAGAHVLAPRLAVDHDAHLLQVGKPLPAGLPVGVAYLISGLRLPIAVIAAPRQEERSFRDWLQNARTGHG